MGASTVNTTALYPAAGENSSIRLFSEMQVQKLTFGTAEKIGGDLPILERANLNGIGRRSIRTLSRYILKGIV
jgi:hypothetical protein